ncbi:MAG: phosphoribosyl-ATP diphosphatase [Burkholderiaceae bacterium]|nr:phosphoribosyl-ATP diphosphatase [Burkholderiaceae bacterium]
MNMQTTFEQLTATIAARKNVSPETSYVAKLFHKGADSILKKIGEEATEVVIAAKDNDREHIVYESADLMFHLMVMLAQYDLSLADVAAELARREGLSGLTEKAARAQ